MNLPGDCEVRGVGAREVLGLRQRVLRPRQKPEELVYPGDDDPDALHAAVLHRGAVVCIASVYRQGLSGVPEGAGLDDLRDLHGAGAWRLRGMATDPQWGGRGLGSATLGLCVEYCRARGGAVLWCHARETAAGFYEKHRFRTRTTVFPIGEIGPHRVMSRNLVADGA